MLLLQWFRSSLDRVTTSARGSSRGWIVGVTAALLAGSAQAATWEVFESKAGRFRIEMPGKPVETTEKRRTIVGSLTGYRFEVENKDSFFLVEYRDLPRAANVFMSRESLIRQAADGLLEFAGGPVERNQKIKVGGEPARSLRYITKKKQTARAQVILAGRRLYLVIAGVPTSQPDQEANVKRFFESFTFWPEP